MEKSWRDLQPPEDPKDNNGLVEKLIPVNQTKKDTASIDNKTNMTQ